MKNTIPLYKRMLAAVCFLGMLIPTYGQTGRRAKKTKYVNIETVIVSSDSGNPIKQAEMIVSEGAHSCFSGADGRVSAKVKTDDIVLIEAPGYEDVVIYMSSAGMPGTIRMNRINALTSGNNIISKPDGGTDNKMNTISSVSSADGRKLEAHPDLMLSNILQGRLPGVVVSSTTGGLGSNNSTFTVRGQHRKGNNAPIVIIDGLERDMNDVLPEEVDKIEVMKDASAKILYGPRAANGVILITSRRGEANKRIVRASVESGAYITRQMPEYLDSYTYATLYNEARSNDGMSPKYSSRQLEGYKNSIGENDLLYPNVDWYGYFMRKQSLYRKVTVDMVGGNDKIRYSLVAGYIGGGGFQAVGKNPDLNRFNVRGNLDVKITDYLSAMADVAARLEIRDLSIKNISSIMSSLSTLRPNEYPLMISPDILGLEPSEDGTPYFGTSIRAVDNLLADVHYGGFSQERYVTSQTNLGLNLNLDKHVKGLTAEAKIMFDNYNSFSQAQTNVYPTYAMVNTNIDSPEFMQMRKISLQSEQSRKSTVTKQTLGYTGNVSYENLFGKNFVGAHLAYTYFKDEVTGDAQDIKNNNTTLRLKYGFDHRFIAEGTIAVMGSNRFSAQNRYFLAGAAGVAWIISNENFLKGSQNVNYLKIKASYGRLGYDGATDFMLYATKWADGTTIKLGEQNKTSLHNHVTSFVRLGDPGLKWESSSEFNAGIEGLFFENRFGVEAEYFNELRDNIITRGNSLYSGIAGDFYPSKNLGTVRNNGAELNLWWEDRSGEFSYRIGANALWSKSKLLKWDEINYKEEYRKSVGLPVDSMFGYEALGLFGKDVPLAGSPYQHLGHYQNGDIAYKDLNEDNLIDARDKKMIGNSFPRLTMGLDMTFGYKGWELYLNGVAQLGFDVMKNNSYYWAKGEGKYSAATLERWHPENNPNGKYPRLTVTEGSNNFVNSTYWLESGSFFRLKDLELSYTFKFTESWCKKLRIFARGTNLFVIGAVKELDPELLNAGVNNYPVYSAVTGGLSITF